MSSPSLQQLRYLVAIADHGGFVAAAENMFVSQPALSSQIKELEKRLGVVLVERSPRGTMLTPIGKQVVERARRVIRDVDDIVGLVDAGGDGLQGRLDLAAIPTVAPYLFMHVVSAVTKEFPGIKLHLHEERTPDLVRKLSEGEIDIGLLALPVPNAEEFITVPIGDDPFLLALPNSHRLAKQKGPVSMSELSETKILLLEEGHCLRDQAIDVCSRVRTSTEDIQATSVATLVQMVAAGLGATLLPQCAAPVEARRGSGIAVRECGKDGPKRTLVLAWRKSSPYQDAYHAIASVVTKQLKGVLSPL